MKKKQFFVLLVLFLFTTKVCLFAADSSTTPEPYTQDEFPGFMHDLRRAEIITLGAMPFITFNITLGYSFVSYALHDFDSSYFVNPFATTSDSETYSTDEQIAIIVTSLAISSGIGLTDFIVNAAKRASRQKRLRNNKNNPIQINPIEKDPEAIKIEKPFEDKEIMPDVDDLQEQFVPIEIEKEISIPGTNNKKQRKNGRKISTVQNNNE